MTFNSIPFLFGFLPLVLVGFRVAGTIGHRAGNAWLLVCSLGFYAAWRLDFLPMLLLSIGFNYGAGRLIAATRQQGYVQGAALGLGVAANLLALVYFKYAAALAGWMGMSSVGGQPFDAIILPLGISFFTFTQIGYLVDARLGTAETRDLLGYGLFVTFFPHLIAGPILHNREMMRQFADPANRRLQGANVAVGLTIFCMGLGKKVLLADPLALDVGRVFGAPATVGLYQAWHATVTYALQLYFDFSGYSDMAIGLARVFNIQFPANFNSPYKALSIIDFWQRWHMTLTRWIGQYLYGPMALQLARWRSGRGLPSRSAGGFGMLVALPTIVSMGLAGAWHGAGKQYLVFGFLHGGYLVVNHAVRTFLPKPAKGRTQRPARRWATDAGKRLVVFVAVLVGFVFFRAGSAAEGWSLVEGMMGLHGGGALPGKLALGRLGLLLAVVWLLPNTQQVMARSQPVLGRAPKPVAGWTWRPSGGWAVACGMVAGLALLALGNATEFLYFQF